MRVNHVNHLKATEGPGSVYPHKFHVTISMTDFVDKYSPLGNDQVSDDVVSMAGKCPTGHITCKLLLFHDLLERIFCVCAEKRSSVLEACHGPEAALLRSARRVAEGASDGQCQVGSYLCKLYTYV